MLVLAVGRWGYGLEKAHDVVMTGPETLQLLHGEPVTVPLTYRNWGNTKADVVVDWQFLEHVRIMDLKTKAILRKRARMIGSYEDGPLRKKYIPPGESRTVATYLGNWGWLPAGEYKVDLVDAGGRPHSMRLTVVDDRKGLREKLQGLATGIVEAVGSFKKADAITEMERYLPEESLKLRLELLEKHFRRLKYVCDNLVWSIICTLMFDDVAEPEPVVKRLAALRDSPGFPASTTKRIESLLAGFPPNRDRPELAAAVKKHFDITLKPPEEWRDPIEDGDDTDGEDPF